jgi:hypothetical protein
MSHQTQIRALCRRSRNPRHPQRGAYLALPSFWRLASGLTRTSLSHSSMRRGLHSLEPSLMSDTVGGWATSRSTQVSRCSRARPASALAPCCAWNSLRVNSARGAMFEVVDDRWAAPLECGTRFSTKDRRRLKGCDGAVRPASTSPCDISEDCDNRQLV